MQGKRNKLLLILGIVVMLLIVGTTVFLLLRTNSQNKKKAAVKPTQSEAESKIQHATLVSYNSVLQSYNTKNYADVVKLARDFDNQVAAQSGEKLQVFSLCLDAAVQVKDDSGKEFCYKKAKELAQASPDERTKTELTKTLDNIYNGVANKSGATSDGLSQ